MVKELEELNKKFIATREQAQNSALSDAAREKNRVSAEEQLTELRERKREFDQTAALRQKQLKDQQMRMRDRIITKLRGFVREYCQKNGIDLALDSALPGSAAPEAVVYSAAKLDITEKILEMIKDGSNNP